LESNEGENRSNAALEERLKWNGTIEAGWRGVFMEEKDPARGELWGSHLAQEVGQTLGLHGEAKSGLG